MIGRTDDQHAVRPKAGVAANGADDAVRLLLVLANGADTRPPRTLGHAQWSERAQVGDQFSDLRAGVHAALHTVKPLAGQPIELMKRLTKRPEAAPGQRRQYLQIDKRAQPCGPDRIMGQGVLEGAVFFETG